MQEACCFVAIPDSEALLQEVALVLPQLNCGRFGSTQKMLGGVQNLLILRQSRETLDSGVNNFLVHPEILKLCFRVLAQSRSRTSGLRFTLRQPSGAAWAGRCGRRCRSSPAAAALHAAPRGRSCGITRAIRSTPPAPTPARAKPAAPRPWQPPASGWRHPARRPWRVRRPVWRRRNRTRPAPRPYRRYRRANRRR